MSGSPDHRSSISTSGYEDGLGRRSVRFNREVGGMLESLRLRPQLVSFESLFRERAADVARLEDERFAPVRGFERSAGGLVVVSDLISGHRLIDVLETRRAETAAVSGIDAAFGLLLQGMPALAALHAAGITHGLVTPGQIIVTSTSQVVLVDCLYGAALERLNLERAALWRSFGLLMPPMAGAAPIDPFADVMQMSVCALLLATGRPLPADATTGDLAPLVREATELAEIRAGAVFSEGLARFFRATLPGQGPRPTLAAESAATEVRRLVSYIDEEGSLAALAELVCFVPLTDADDASTSAEPAETAPPVVEATSPEEAVAVIADAAPQPDVRPAPAWTPTVVTTPVARPAAVHAVSIPVFPVPAPVAVPVPAWTPPPAPPAPLNLAPAPPTPPPTLRIRQEAPQGYAPPSNRRSAGASLPDRALPFVARGSEGTRRAGFPYKGAAAAALLISVGLFGGRAYLENGGQPFDAAVVPLRAAAATLAAPAAAPLTGSVAIESQPAGAQVILDGKHVGVTPLLLGDVAPGRHRFTLLSGSARVERTVRVAAGETTALEVPVFSGWVAVFAPIRLDIAEGRRTLGSTESGRILLPPGRHVLAVSNAELGFSATHTVEIRPGEETVLNLRPTGLVNLNASPWAEVWIDGARAGETPLANLEVPLGTREFVFKHPQHGERRLTATVTVTASALSVDFSNRTIAR